MNIELTDFLPAFTEVCGEKDVNIAWSVLKDKILALISEHIPSKFLTAKR